MHQNTENVQAELKECLMISAHEVNFQRRRKYSFKILFKALQRSSLVTTDDQNCLLIQSTRENNGKSTSNLEATTLGDAKISDIWHTSLHFFIKKYVRIFNALYSTVFRKLIFLIIIFFSNTIYSFFFSFACLALLNSLLFRFDHNELVLFHFLSYKLRFKSTLYLSWKFIEVSCETESRTEFAIGAAFRRFPISMNFWNKLSFASRMFVITSVLTFWYGLICKSQM